MDTTQSNAEYSESDTDHQDSDDSPRTIHEVAVIVVDNFKYIFKSGSLRTKLRTWRCSFKPSCKAMITVNRDGDVIYASNDHCHAALSYQQILNGSRNEVLLFKNVKIVAKNMGERAENHSETGYSEGDLRKQESAFPKLGTAFSVAGHEGMMMMNHVIQDQPKRDESLGDETSMESGTQSNEKQDIPSFSAALSLANQTEMPRQLLVTGNSHSGQFIVAGNDIARNPKSAVIRNFSVTKNTRTMQNILAQALRKLDGNDFSDEPIKSPTGSSKPSRRLPEKSEPKDESDEEDEWQRQYMKQEPDEDDEEDDKEINVEVSEEEEEEKEQVINIDEDEMATILGE